MKRIVNVTAVLTAAAAALVSAGSFFLASFTVHGRRQTLDEAFNWQKEHYDLSWFDALSKKSYTISSFDGYELHVMLLKNEKAAAGNKYVIISHGYTDNRMGSLKYAKIYLDRGFGCILYDLRGHGENERTYCTYSIRESRDLACLIDDTYTRYGQDILLGLHGESLGAATTIASLGLQQKTAFAAADCPFADIENVLKGGMKNAHLPAWIVDLAGMAAKIRYGYSFKEMRPIDALAGNKVPVLFLHGADDTFILPSNSERMQKAAAGRSELHLIPGAGHAESVLKQPVLYDETVNSFLDQLGL